MPEKQRAPGGDKIDKTIPVLIKKIGAFGLFNKHRGTPYGLECPYGGIHPSG
jgi:hypothetical protein